MACPSCGKELPGKFPFCPFCGSPVIEARPASAREERKVVTCLFCDLVGFTSRAEAMDPEDVRALLSPYHAHLRSELERFGGTVEKFIGDAVMALFGAPVAHEDDPERAVRAAIAIRDWAREREDLQVRLGVTTGEALIRLDAQPGETTAAGDVVNTASRLQSGAPENGILVDETTYRATDQAIDYEQVEPVEAKGKAERITAWEALEARSHVGVEAFETGATLVGRRRELDVLLDAFTRARSENEPQCVTLVGVPGIGKSRLVYEFFRQGVEADSGAHLLAARPMPAVRRRRHVLGCRGDGEGAGGDPRDRRGRRGGSEARASRRGGGRRRGPLGAREHPPARRARRGG